MLILTNINAQGFIEKLITEESNVKVIEERTNEYQKVKSDKENKLFQRSLYLPKLMRTKRAGYLKS